MAVVSGAAERFRGDGRQRRGVRRRARRPGERRVGYEERIDEHDALQVLRAHRESTVARITAMTAELAEVAAASADSNLDDEHDPEGSTVAFERAQLAALLLQAREHLRDIDGALRRLAAAQYGLCECCGVPIGDERLAALPMARRCMACASRPEQ